MPTDAAPSLANWIAGPLSARLNKEHLEFSKSRVSPEQLKELHECVVRGEISNSTAVATVLGAMWSDGGTAADIIRNKDLRQLSDADAIEKIVDEVLAKNAKQVEDYRAGKDKAFNSLVGQVMKATQGKANPAQVNAILKAKLSR